MPSNVETNTQVKFDLVMFGIPKIFVMETELKNEEQRKAMGEAMRDVFTAVEGIDASVFLREISLRGVGMYFGGKLAERLAKDGIDCGALEFYEAPQSFVYHLSV